MKLKWISALLAGFLLAGTCTAVFTGCAKPTEDHHETSDTTAAVTASAGESETVDPAKAALDALDKLDYGGKDFTVLAFEGFKNEVEGVAGTLDKEENADQIINDAVYQRNTLMEERFSLKMQTILKPIFDVDGAIMREVQSPTGDFQLIDHRLVESAQQACSNRLCDYNLLGIDLDQPWWDSGTADFSLAGGIYFMNGSINFRDDDLTFVLMFNKDMQKQYANTVPDPYEMVKNNEWTLERFYNIIQGVSNDSSGDGQWNEMDTYGFATTWEYGITFFFGCGLRYILNDRESDKPSLFLEDKSRMEKALQVLDLAQSIYHDNNATFMSPPGQEGQGINMFKDGRTLFFGEVAQYLSIMKSEMDNSYGVVPVPKYDEDQKNYLTWTHEAGSTFSVPSSVNEAQAEEIGTLLEAYAIMAHQYVKPAYYDIMLTSRNVRDPESAAMLDIIFRNRVYDMAIYFLDLGMKDSFKNCVNNNSDNFSSLYKSASSRCLKRLDRIMTRLERGR